MAGHSKWKTIKHKKAAADAKRSKHFTKIIKEITVAARHGGGDPSGNPRLRFLLDKAKEINMPLENAQRAIKKGTGELPGQQYESITYEGYGPENIAVIVDVLTDNKNKAIAELRHAFSRNGGRIAETGSVGWMFERLGVINASGGNLTEDELIEKLLDYDIIDTEKIDSTFVIKCSPKALDTVKQAIANLGLKIDEAELEWVARTPMALSGGEEEKAINFLDALEELEDVQNVYTNLG
jgi:YebC/PmpR family DNA-binding regulatory protein